VSGLSVIINWNGAPADCGLFDRCNQAAAHRGVPAATHVAGAVAMSSLAPAGGASRPALALDPEAGLALVLVGRIYDRQQLATDLGENGVHDDAALILAAWKRWGSDCLTRLDGDFAFVLHDARRNTVIGARDAFGMHPLCYFFDARRVIAASEPRQVLAAGVPARPCEESIAAYVASARHLYGGPRSFYEDVYRVEPGHFVEIQAAGARSTRYWQLDPDRQLAERNDEDMAARVRELMIDSVRRRMPDAGPYACAVSGGFDSSTVAALLGRAVGSGNGGPALETFSFELRDLESDEPELIEAVVRDLGTNHHHIYLDEDNVFSVLPQMLAACDEPTFDMGLLYLWRKKEFAARQGVRVMLSGLGGDELFVGQFHFLSDLLRSLRLPTLWKELRGVYPVDRYKGQRTSLAKLLRAYVVGPLIPRPTKRLARRLLLGQGTVPPWIAPSLAQRVALADRIEEGPERLYDDAYRQDCHEVFKSSLLAVTLPLHESLGAAFGIETRFPLLDRRLVEYLFAAPREQKIRFGEVRGIQRRAMRGLLPDAVLTRHVKKSLNPVLRRQQQQNFVVELEKLFSRSELRCEQYLDADYLRASYQAFHAGGGTNDAALALWHAMNLEQWLRGLEH
jgi:asparagine synthase (glutamine-hydrolysing)